MSEKQKKYSLNIPEAEYRLIERALSNFRTMAEDTWAKTKMMFGEDSPHTAQAWEAFIETDNLLSDFVNGKYEPTDIE